MELTLTLLFIAAVGVAAGLLLAALDRKFSLSISWPALFFLCLAGGSVTSLVAVINVGARSLLHTTSGLLAGDNLDALVNCILILCFALPAMAAAAISGRAVPSLKQKRQAGPWVSLIFGLAVSQSLLSVPALLWGVWFPGLWTPAQLVGMGMLMSVLTFGLGLFLGRRWGGNSVAAVIFTVALVLIDLGGILGMLAQCKDPGWGLALVQTPAGAFFTRWNLPVALLLSTSQAVVPVTPALLIGAALLSRLAFLGGWYCGGRRR